MGNERQRNMHAFGYNRHFDMAGTDCHHEKDLNASVPDVGMVVWLYTLQDFESLAMKNLEYTNISGPR